MGDNLSAYEESHSAFLSPYLCGAVLGIYLPMLRFHSSIQICSHDSFQSVVYLQATDNAGEYHRVKCPYFTTVNRGPRHGIHSMFYQLLLVALVLICLLLHVGWSDNPPRVPHTPPEPHLRRRRRAKEPKPFPGLLHKPLCEADEKGANEHAKAPGSPPPVIIFTRGRWRTVDTHKHFCPAPGCSSRGRRGRGHLRAHGPPGGKAWRQLQYQRQQFSQGVVAFQSMKRRSSPERYSSC